MSMQPYGYCVVVTLSGRNKVLYYPKRIHRSRIVDTIQQAEMIKLEWASWEDSGFFELEIVTLYTNEIFDEPIGYIHKDDLSKLLSETGNHLTVGLDTRRAWPVGFGESKPYDHLSPIYTTPQNAVVNEQLLMALKFADVALRGQHHAKGKDVIKIKMK